MACSQQASMWFWKLPPWPLPLPQPPLLVLWLSLLPLPLTPPPLLLSLLQAWSMKVSMLASLSLTCLHYISRWFRKLSSQLLLPSLLQPSPSPLLLLLPPKKVKCYLGHHHTGRPLLGLFTPGLQVVQEVQSQPTHIHSHIAHQKFTIHLNPFNTHTHTQTHTHTHTHTHTNTHTYMCVHMYMHTHTHTHTHTNDYEHDYVKSTLTNTQAHTRMYTQKIHMCSHKKHSHTNMHTHTYTHTPSHTHSHNYTHTQHTLTQSWHSRCVRQGYPHSWCTPACYPLHLPLPLFLSQRLRLLLEAPPLWLRPPPSLPQLYLFPPVGMECLQGHHADRQPWGRRRWCLSGWTGPQPPPSAWVWGHPPPATQHRKVLDERWRPSG